MPVAFSCPTRRPASAVPLGYESFEHRSEVFIWPRPGPSTWVLASSPTGSGPALFVLVSDGLVSKP
jgi:hypothetical protein